MPWRSQLQRQDSITKINQLVQIHIKTFPLNPESYEFRSAQYVDNLYVSGSILPKLHIIWPSLKILSTMTNENYQLPSSIPLTWTEAKTLRGILMKPFWCLCDEVS